MVAQHPEEDPQRPLNPPSPQPGHNDDQPRRDGYFWVHAIAFFILTYNTAIAAYRSAHEPSTLAFVLASYVDLVLLFLCLRVFERTPLNSPRRSWLKAAVWLLATLLTVLFSQKVASIMPWPVAVVVWAMAAATALGGFYAFFVYRDSDNGHGGSSSKP